MKCFLIVFFFFYSMLIYSQKVDTSLSQRYFLNERIYEIRTQKFQKSLHKQSLYNMLFEAGYLIKEDSILISFEIKSPRLKYLVPSMEQSGAKLNRVIKGESYYAGYVQIDSLLRYPEKFPLPNLDIQLGDRMGEGDNSGPVRTNSASYETGTSNNPNAGNGITIAIIDCAWEGMFLSAQNGVAPNSYTYFDCSSGNCDGTQTIPGGLSSQNSDHGTDVTQIVFDHAPAASYILYKSCGNSGRAAAILHAIDQGAQIIACSESGYNTGWDDNTGILCNAVNTAVNNDVLMFFSAGNRNNGRHWQGSFKDSDGDNFHEWSGADENNDVSIGASSGNNNQLRIMMQWDGVTDAYEMRYYDKGTGQVVKTCDSGSQFEDCSWTNSADSVVNIGIVVKAKIANPPQFEIITRFSNPNPFFQFSSTSNQTTSPGNCSTNPNVLAVAAVDKLLYDSTNAVIASFSSVGPSNNNIASVKITAPTNDTIMDFDGMGGTPARTFGGTSCATPNAAGATAAFWSKHPALSAEDVRNIILKKASIYKDWGINGYDDIYGNGGIYLYSYHSMNIFIDQQAGTNGVAPANGIYPWDNVKDVDALAPLDKKAIMFSNDTVSPAVILDKKMFYKAAGKTFVIK